MKIQRTEYLEQIIHQHQVHPICALLGPRQVGKTTLARQYAVHFNKPIFFDLENPVDLASLANPMLALQNLDNDLIIIDEIQRLPDLFPVLRYLVDQRPYKFLILGSASRDLIRQSSESLAGRIGYLQLPPFSLQECPDLTKLWVRGGFPLSYLAGSNQFSQTWRQSYITTFMERDIPQLGFSIPPQLMRRLWMMLAHNHGNILNMSDIGRSLEITHQKVRAYTEILTGTFMTRLLEPWFANISKRQVKTPKIYIRDSGILHSLLSITQYEELIMHPKLGASWEGFALEEVVKLFGAQDSELFFWATQGGAELDLFLLKNGKRLGFEFKYSQNPRITPSMHSALEDLRLDHLFVIYPYPKTFPLAPRVTACGLGTPEFFGLPKA